MNWDAVSAVAEVIGVIVVIMSLVYFAAQVRQGNQMALAESERELLENWAAAISICHSTRTLEIRLRMLRLLRTFKVEERKMEAKFILNLFSMVLIVTLVGCTDTSKITSEQLIFEETTVLLKDSKAIENHDSLVRTLKIPKVRASSINIGQPGLDAIRRSFSGPFTNSYMCRVASCSCTGDTECNKMFSGVCRDPRSGGSCTGSGSSTVCTCNPDNVPPDNLPG